MRFYIANTDYNWYKYLSKIQPEDVNFWQPGGNANFKAIETGAPFLFRLKSPINKIAGVAFFAKHSILPYTIAWDIFKQNNGVEGIFDFVSRINKLRHYTVSVGEKPNIGCIVLTNPIFFKENEWVDLPVDWSPSIQQGKTYSTADAIGNSYWKIIQANINKYSTSIDNNQQNWDEKSPLYNLGISKIRIGQGAFRVMVTDAYSRRCAISGERTLPVLEAAHIQPYATSGINQTNNGLLLRSDLHKLFDTGYITITDQYEIEISKRIREEFENGRDYYKYHGKGLASMPENIYEYPNREYLRWHNVSVFK